MLVIIPVEDYLIIYSIYSYHNKAATPIIILSGSCQKTSFVIGDYCDILVYGDQERFVEVMQNLMENAIKYGDGVEVLITIDYKGGNKF